MLPDCTGAGAAVVVLFDFAAVAAVLLDCWYCSTVLVLGLMLLLFDLSCGCTVRLLLDCTGAGAAGAAVVAVRCFIGLL